jgi:V/A-type H+-transporting ATPase subunit A
MVLLAGRLVREGVLQQSAVSRADAFCDPARAGALVDAVLAVSDRCRSLVEQNLPPGVVEDVDYGALVRAREEAVDVAAVARVRDQVLSTLEGLS